MTTSVLQWVAAGLALFITAGVLCYSMMFLAMTVVFGEGGFMPWGLGLGIACGVAVWGTFLLVRAAVRG